VSEGVVVRPDQVSLGVLVSAVPRDLVDEAVAVCGVREKRSDGKLPAHVITYLTLALSLFPDEDYTEVATKVTGSLDRWGCWNAGWTVPTTSAITQARKRLGRQVFPELFERTCGPVAGPAVPTAGVAALGTARGSFLRRWRLLGIDGFEVDLPDTKENAVEFGYAGSGDNRSAFPKARVVALAECGTHAFVAAEVDAYAVGRRPWRPGCCRGCAPMSCSPPTAGSTPGRPGTPPPQRVRRCCGGPRPSSTCQSWPCWTTAPTSPP
jgi:Insertion element 4 transposase N-terminal